MPRTCESLSQTRGWRTINNHGQVSVSENTSSVLEGGRLVTALGLVELNVANEEDTREDLEDVVDLSVVEANDLDGTLLQ